MALRPGRCRARSRYRAGAREYADYFSVPEDDIKRIEAVLTIVGGAVVYGAGPFEPLAPPLPPISPNWSPVARYGGSFRGEAAVTAPAPPCSHASWFRTFADEARRLFAGPTPVGLPCECFAF